MSNDPRITGLIVGKFAPLHKGHQYLIETALADPTLDRLLVLVYANPDFPWISSQRRAGWIRALYPQAEVYVPENPPPDDADDHTQREFVKEWLAQHKLEVRKVYTSEGYGPGFAQHIGAEHVSVDLQRERFPISGTQVRTWVKEIAESIEVKVTGTWENSHSQARLTQWVHPQVVRDLLHWLDPVKKVVFLGAESTGKTTLTQRMAQEFGSLFVHEYGREYYERKGGKLVLEDYVQIACQHLELENRARLELAHTKGSSYLFVDTNALTTLFFSYYYNQGGLPRLHQLANACKERYHYFFVCDDDIPFEQDGWRDNAVWRGRMQGLILHDLDCRGIEYSVVRGSLEERVEQVKRVLAGLPLDTPPSSPRHLGPRP